MTFELDPIEHALFEPGLGIGQRSEEAHRVDGRRQLVDRVATPPAGVEMSERVASLVARDHPEREIRRDRGDVRTVHRYCCTSAASAPRKRMRPVRTLVFAVPSGMCSSSLISTAVRP